MKIELQNQEIEESDKKIKIARDETISQQQLNAIYFLLVFSEELPTKDTKTLRTIQDTRALTKNDRIQIQRIISEQSDLIQIIEQEIGCEISTYFLDDGK